MKDNIVSVAEVSYRRISVAEIILCQLQSANRTITGRLYIFLENVHAAKIEVNVSINQSRNDRHLTHVEDIIRSLRRLRRKNLDNLLSFEDDVRTVAVKSRCKFRNDATIS